MFTKLLEKLKSSKKRRELFVAGQIKTGIPFQVRALRDKKDWTQAQLGAELGMTQTNVSRLESPGYGRLNITTLQRIASVFDVALVVRFVPFSELMRWTDNLSPEVMAPQSFDEEIRELEEAAFTTASGWQGIRLTQPNMLLRGTPHSWGEGKVFRFGGTVDLITAPSEEVDEDAYWSETDTGFIPESAPIPMTAEIVSELTM
jgi:transcriptional regulator with XRE-family HTH domain